MTSQYHALIQQLLEIDDMPHLLRQNASLLIDEFFYTLKNEFVLQIQANNKETQAQIVQMLQLIWDEYLEDLSLKGLLLWVRGLAEGFSGDWETAVTTTQHAITIFDQLGETETYCQLVSNLINIYVFLHRPDEVDELAQTAVAKLDDSSVVKGRLLWNWAGANYALHKNSHAISLMQQAEPYISQLSEADQARFAGDHASILLRADRYTEALTISQKADAFFSAWKEERPFDWGRHTWQMAGIYHKMGQLGEALTYTNEAILAYAQQDWQKEDLAYAVIRHAEILLEIGQYGRVLDTLTAPSLDTLTPREQSQVWLLRSVALTRLDEWEEGEIALQKALELGEAISPQWQQLIQMALCQLYLQWGQDAPRYLNKLQSLLETLPTPDDHEIREVEIQLLKVESDLLQHKIEDAEEALQHVPTISTPSIQAQTSYLQGCIAAHHQDWATAQTAFQHALKEAMHLHTQLYLEELQVSVLAQREQLMQHLLHACYQAQDVSKLWLYSEQNRALGLTGALQRETAVGLPQHQSLYDQRAKRFRLANELLTEKKSVVKQAQTRQELQQLDKEIRASYQAGEATDLDPHTLAKPIELQQIPPCLPPNTLLLTYTRVQNQVWVISFDQKGIVHQQMLPYTWREMQQAISQFTQIGFRQWVHAIRSEGELHTQRHFQKYLTEAQQRLHTLHQMLWQPLQPTHQSVVIVADDILKHVPFQALYDGQQYLIDTHTISYAPSASLYHLCQQRYQQRPLGEDVLLLAHRGQRQDLLFVEQEVKTIAKRYPQAQLFLDDEVTIDNLFTFAPRSWLVHLATHGHVEQSPFLSYLELSQEKTLRMYDAAQLNLHHTDLVVLSACESANVQQHGGDLLGLLWGFLYAGATCLLVNQWQVDDYSPTVLMETFYQQYKKGGDKAQSLRQAQLSLREQDSPQRWYFAHPYTWSPFVVYGYPHAKTGA